MSCDVGKATEGLENEFDAAELTERLENELLASRPCYKALLIYGLEFLHLVTPNLSSNPLVV